jgi:K+-sensing histidine kinase KdpD
MAIERTMWGRRLRSYGAAVAAAVAGLLIRWALEAWVGPGLPTYLTFYPTVMAAALFGGLVPGVVATVVSALLADYWVIPPQGFNVQKPADAVGLLFFFGVGMGMSIVIEYGRRARLKAAAYDREAVLRETRQQAEENLRKLNAELERRVAEQTAQIRQSNQELEQRVAARTAELQTATGALQASRGATLSLLEDALEARSATEQANAKLQAAVESLDSSRKAAFNLMEDSVRARAEAEDANAKLRENQERLLKLNRVLNALKESSLAMVHSTSEAEYLAEVCKIVVEDCGHTLVWIGFAVDDEEKSIRPAAYSGFEAGYLETLRVCWADTERGRGPTGIAIRTGQPAMCKNMLTDPAFAPWRAAALQRGYASSLAIPLLAVGSDACSVPSGEAQVTRHPLLVSRKAFGALTLYAKEPGGFSDDEVKLLIQLADDIAYCIGALRQQVERKQAERRTELLAETARQLLASDSPQLVIEDLCHRVLAFLDCQVFFNFLVDEKAGRLHLNACGGVPPEEVPRFEWLDFGAAVCGCAAREAQRIVTENIRHTNDPRTELVKSLGVQAYAAFPLIAQQRVLGTLSFGLRERPWVTPDELNLMKAVADQVAIALERQRVQAALRQTAENLKRSNLDLEQFAYVASHDLQEPLRAVGGYIKLLERNLPKPLEAKLQGYISGAFEGAVRMERLINDLLDYSRVDSRGRALVPTELEGVLRQALTNLQPRIASAKAAITHERLPKVSADSTQIMQVFQNLVGNAIKFRGAPPPAIHIGASQRNGDWVISVRDNGIGIDPEYFGKIFHLFSRLHTRKQYPGTGIGLTVCKRIIERHGGAIWVESQPGKGATFYFSLPNAK